MKIGIIPNIYKPEVVKVIHKIISEIKKNNLEFVLSNSLEKLADELKIEINDGVFYSHSELAKRCDMIVSIGGDGTMLNTAFDIKESNTPILGLNYGKLGFLAEFDLDAFCVFLSEIKDKSYIIDERMSLGALVNGNSTPLFAINDFVIDKGPWPKMIEITIKVDEDYVSTFSADGLIIATPTGTTGYSLSAGGPIVNPKANVITLSPIAPHTLTIRPLVISSDQVITIEVNSPQNNIQISCDGQRVHNFNSPSKVVIKKNENPIRLIHSTRNSYFEILRKKLFWGLDIRKTNN